MTFSYWWHTYHDVQILHVAQMIFVILYLYYQFDCEIKTNLSLILVKNLESKI
jgi:hypothetical protein